MHDTGGVTTGPASLNPGVRYLRTSLGLSFALAYWAVVRAD